MKLVEITSIKKYEYTGKVHDLEIEEDHSYNIDGVVVHNSDYVMLGSMLNKAYESSGKTFISKDETLSLFNENEQLWVEKKTDKGISYFDTKIFSIEELIKVGVLHKEYRGMSTKEVQKDWGRTQLKTAEGISKQNKVEYTLVGFVENLEAYLRSCMSYVGAKNLNELKGTNYELITQNAFKRFDK